jgi:uncharacterized protein YdeI (YjbR/CyaY-like superfamily)
MRIERFTRTDRGAMRACPAARRRHRSRPHGIPIPKAAKIKRVGDPVQVEIWKHPNPDELDLPEALAETLDFLPEMKAAWYALTPGMKRSMCYWVGSAKTEATQVKRVAELLRRFEAGDLQVGKSRKT